MLQLRRILRAVSLLAVFAGTSTFGFAQTPCTVPDTAGTVLLPPAGCDYLSPTEFHMIVDGLPPSTTIEIDPIHRNFVCGQYVSCPVPGVCNTPDNSIFPGGEKECYETELALDMNGTGALAGFNRNISVQAYMETHTDQRPPGSLQIFDAEMTALQGQLVGDPDFQLLRITAGRDFGLPPSTGQVTATQLGGAGSNWNVESFFDVHYEITFQGAPGSVLDGMSGTTPGMIRMSTGVPVGPGPGIPAMPPGWMIVFTVILLGAGCFILMRRQQAPAA